MAATSTNKQPLFIDRVLHYVVNLNQNANDGLDVAPNNTAKLLVDATASDGAILEDIYLISRSNATAYVVNFYLSTERDFLRPDKGMFIGSVSAPSVEKEVLHWNGMPICLAPVPHVGANPFNRAMYIPKGYALWVAREGSGNEGDAPLVGCQGGWY